MTDLNSGDAQPLQAGADLEALEIGPIEAEGRDLQDMRVLDCTISRTNLRGADLSGAELDHVRFESCDLAGVTWAGTCFEEVEFVDCNLTGIDWTGAHWSSLSLPAPVTFRRCRLDLSSFLGLSLTELKIEGGSAVETDFSDADLRRATLRNLDLCGAIFNRTDLRDAHLEGSTDYLINPKSNRINRCSVSFPGATSFLVALDLQLVDPPHRERPEF